MDWSSKWVPAIIQYAKSSAGKKVQDCYEKAEKTNAGIGLTSLCSRPINNINVCL